MNPKVEQLIQEEREREAKKRAEILISLGLCEEEREYAKQNFSCGADARRAGFDHSEMVDGVCQRYRVKRITPLKLTDEEYAKVYEIYQARKAEQARDEGTQPQFVQPSIVSIGDAKMTGTAKATASSPDGLASTLARWMSVISWVGGGLCAIVLAFISGEFNLAVLLGCGIGFFFTGLFWLAISQVLGTLDSIAANTSLQTIQLELKRK